MTIMSIRNKLKTILPAYRTERILEARIAELNKNVRETNEKNEYLFWLSQMQPGETMQQTKERVFLQMPKATGRLRKIQLAENYILRRVKDVCDENGLELFLVGGTLLGAVRHRGFIPWDNDVDVGMMKQDYLKLREILAKDPELSLEYYYNYKAGLRMSKVKFRAVEVFWIDILVFDRIDCGGKDIGEAWNETRKANREFSRRLGQMAEPWKASYPGRPVANPELDRLTAELAAGMEKDHPEMGRGDFFCGTLDTPFWGRDPRGIKPFGKHFPLRKSAVEFEGVLYDVWDNYEEAMTHMYGDWQSLPFSINEPHTTELDAGMEEGFAYLRGRGIIPGEED